MTRFALLTLLLSTTLSAQGVTDQEILLGQSCALKGQAAALGTGMQTGLNVYFDKVNAAGGINGRQVKLVSVNDGYEPDRCVKAVKMLIEQQKVFALIGGVGTPTAKVAVPVCTEAKVPFIAAFTGAELLRTPFNPYVVNMRASYFQETEALASYLIDNNGKKRVACFYQDDAYGAAGLEGIKRALAKRNMELVSTGNYKRNTLAVAEGLDSVAAGKPEAVLLIGAYAPCAQFMKQAKNNPSLAGATLCNISFVGTNNLVEAAGSAGEGSLISQCVPFPEDETIPVVKQYRADMKKAGKQDEIGFISLEGYLAAKFFTEVATKAGRNLTRDSLLAAVQGTYDLGGMVLTFDEKDSQGSDSVFLTTVQNGKVVSVPTTPSAAPGK
ncbi:MAG: ABC transporter substrate-binding protein [Planctomycetes bacterium]|nr:ABC transporter substrate-binding protein [Planctomycetota bacterium]